MKLLLLSAFACACIVPMECQKANEKEKTKVVSNPDSMATEKNSFVKAGFGDTKDSLR